MNPGRVAGVSRLRPQVTWQVSKVGLAIGAYGLEIDQGRTGPRERPATILPARGWTTSRAGRRGCAGGGRRILKSARLKVRQKAIEPTNERQC